MSVRRWLPPLVLALVCASGLVGALSTWPPADPASSTSLPPSARTPVLSLRRAAEVVAAPVAARRLDRALDAWVDAAPGQHCVSVVDDRGHELHSTDADRALTPASTLKVLTATAALLALGDDHTFDTRALAARGPVDGVIAGDLWLVGGGDPVLGTRAYASRVPDRPLVFTDIETLAQAVRDAGVREITGSVVGDDTLYDAERRVASWSAAWVVQGRAGPIGALVVDDGFVRAPDIEDGGGVAAADPARHAAEQFTARLEALGVQVGRAARSERRRHSGTVVASVSSPPLHAVVRQLLEQSDLNTAELLVKALGRADGRDGSTERGLGALRRTLERAGIDLSDAVLADGSGISLQSKLSCRVLVDVLRHAPTNDTIVDSLPVANRSGTLRDRFAGSPVAGRLRAKTGSLSGVAALAGVVPTRAGPTLTFAYIANGQGLASEAALAHRDALGTVLDTYELDVTALVPRR